MGKLASSKEDGEVSAKKEQVLAFQRRSELRKTLLGSLERLYRTTFAHVRGQASGGLCVGGVQVIVEELWRRQDERVWLIRFVRELFVCDESALWKEFVLLDRISLPP